MSNFGKFQNPTQRGTEVFPEVITAPPAVHVVVRASKPWFDRSVQDRETIAAKMMADMHMDIQSYILAQRGDYNAGVAPYYKTTREFEGARVTYMNIQGSERVHIDLFPESIAPAGGKLKIKAPPGTWPIGYKEAGAPDYSVAMGWDGTDENARWEGTAVYFQPLRKKLYWEYYLKEFERPGRSFEVPGQGWEGNVTDPPTPGWQGWERMPRYGIIPKDGVWADKTDRTFGYAWDDLFESWGLGGPVAANLATDENTRIHSTFYLLGNFFFQDTPGEGQPDPGWPDNVGQADICVHREFFFPPPEGSSTTTTYQTGGGWVARIASIAAPVAAAGFNKSVGDDMLFSFSYSSVDPNGTAPVLYFNYPIYWDNNSPHTTPPHTYRTQQTFRVGPNRFLDDPTDVFYQTDAYSVSHVVTGLNFGAFDPAAPPEPSRADYAAWVAWATNNFLGEISCNIVWTTPTYTSVTTTTGADYTTGTPFFMDNAWHAGVCKGAPSLCQIAPTVYRITEYLGLDLIEKWRREDKVGDVVQERGMVIMFAFDADVGELYVGVDGKWYSETGPGTFADAKAITVDPSTDWFPACSYSTYYTATDMLFGSAQNYDPPNGYGRLGAIGEDFEIDLP